MSHNILWLVSIILFVFLAVVPARETPLMFAHPHVKACFSAAGKLISIVPSLYSRCIEISCVKVSVQPLILSMRGIKASELIDN